MAARLTHQGPVRTSPLVYANQWNPRLPINLGSTSSDNEIRGKGNAIHLVDALAAGRVNGIDACAAGVIFNVGNGVVSVARAGRLSRSGIFADPLIQAAANACQQRPKRKNPFSLEGEWHGAGFMPASPARQFLRRAALYWAGGGRHIDVMDRSGVTGMGILSALGLADRNIDSIFASGPAKGVVEYHTLVSRQPFGDGDLALGDVAEWRYLDPQDENQKGNYQLSLPLWISEFAAEHGLQQFGEIDPETAMRLSIALADKNVLEDTGGPFGGMITIKHQGKELLLTLGVNRVVPTPGSNWHGEMVNYHYLLALLNEDVSGDLASLLKNSEITVYTNACTCIQCAAGAMTVLTAVAGSVKIVYAATQAQVEQLTTFDEGNIRESDIVAMLANEGIVAEHVDDPSALGALSEFGRLVRGGVRTVYNADGVAVVKDGDKDTPAGTK